ncbi:MAG: autotransporter domain-containing protein [Mesorhizobium sp.]|uniref:autotransporter outer membrane beta-barrel domain-containing protein n=1 Tax=Mesorhizobium sp. TaxID=1871066 RepID=UPI000FE82F4A|nr:autotransporter outer membrane beta-barrel domain-containing protein [Mesorhizobium sp.]RWP90297.1 MAG: autotransporter domain-containing protein [Mesorhizobium sp.]
MQFYLIYSWLLRASRSCFTVPLCVLAFAAAAANPAFAQTISVGDVAIVEGDAGTTSAQFAVTLSSASANSISVQVGTADGTATAGSDYVAQSVGLTFLPGATTATINVPVNGDTISEPDETFTLNLSNPVNVTIADGQGLGTILNDDAALPTAPNLTATVLAGATVTVPLTPGATGGPFSAATIVSSLPVEGGVSTIVGAPNYALQFDATPVFEGVVVVNYTLTGPGGVSDPATVTITVQARPDPSTDPDVRGLLTAQAQAAQQFAQSQMDNINRRMAALHDESCRQFLANTVQLSGPDADGGTERLSTPQLNELCDDGAQKLGLSMWTSGSVDVGSTDRAGEAGRDSIAYNLTAGVDYRFSQRFVGGISLGYSTDSSDIGTNGTTSDGEAISAAIYGSFMATPSFFVDALIGYGSFDFNSRRFDTSSGAFGSGDRDGDQFYASLTAGYDTQLRAWKLTPFARLSGSSSILNGFSETGAGEYSLAYGRQQVDSFGGSLGFAASTDLALEVGTLTPRLRLEYMHEFEGDSSVDIRYADLPEGLIYNVQTQAFAQNQVTLGLGADLHLNNGMRLGLDYTGNFGFEDSRRHGVRASVGGQF